MLLINFFKKTSVKDIVLKVNFFLMFFLFGLLFFSVDSLPSNLYKEKSEAKLSSELHFIGKDKTHQALFQHAEIAQQQLIYHQQQYEHLSLLMFVLVLVLFVYVAYRCKWLKNRESDDFKELKQTLIKAEIQNKRQAQQLMIINGFYENLEAQLHHIETSISSITSQFEIRDKKLTQKLSTISNFTVLVIQNYHDTIKILRQT